MSKVVGAQSSSPAAPTPSTTKSRSPELSQATESKKVPSGLHNLSDETLFTRPQGPEVKPLAPEKLSLRDIIEGVGVSSSIEVRNEDIEGFDTRDESGNAWTVILSRPPRKDCSTKAQALDNTSPPTVLSMQTNLIGIDGHSVDTLVRHFEIASSISEEARATAAVQLDEAADLMRDPGRFGDGLSLLEDLCGRGEVVRTTYQPDIDEFEFSAEQVSTLSNKDLEILLKVWLNSHGVPFETWGRGEAKDIHDLRKELCEREGKLSCVGGEVYLESKVVLLWVESPDGSKRLFEDHQRFKDGRTRRRRNLGGLPAEKAKDGEHPVEAVSRLLKEELGIHRRLEIDGGDVSVRIEPSQCFPGVLKRNTYLIFNTRITEKEYKSKYIEHDSKKDTVFRWARVPRSHQDLVQDAVPPSAPNSSSQPSAS